MRNVILNPRRGEKVHAPNHQSRSAWIGWKILTVIAVAAVTLALASVFHTLADAGRGNITPLGGGETFATVLAPVIIWGFWRCRKDSQN